MENGAHAVETDSGQSLETQQIEQGRRLLRWIYQMPLTIGIILIL
jgi:hypothetical protein